MNSFFTALIVLLPILAVYRSPFPGMDFGTFLLLFFTVTVFVTGHFPHKIKIPKILLVLMVYIAITTLLNIFFADDELQNPVNLVLLRTLKFILIPLLVFLFNSTFFDHSLGIKFLRYISFAAVCYLILQIAIYRWFGLLLPNVVMSLILQGNYENVDYEYAAEYFLRPASFFLEPAYFSQYIVVYLIYSLFRLNSTEKALLGSALFCSIGIFLSTSGQGIAYMLGSWGLYFCRILFSRSSSENIWKGGLLLVAFGLVGYFFMDNGIIVYAWERIFGSQHGGNAFIARTSSDELFFELSPFQHFSGVGFGNPLPDTYFSSLSYFLYCTGYIGTFIVILFFLVSYCQVKSYQRVLVLVIALLCCIGLLFTAVGISFYFTFILASAKIIKSDTLSQNEEKKL